MRVTLEAIKNRCRIERECWIWQGAKVHAQPSWPIHNGGDRFNLRVQKHVLELSGEVVPMGAPIQSSCGNKLCCNPMHLVVHAPRTRSAFLAAVKGNPWGWLLWKAA